MFIETNPFPYLKSGQYAGFGDGEIIILDKSVPEEKIEWIKSEYKKWWNERQNEMIKEDIS